MLLVSLHLVCMLSAMREVCCPHDRHLGEIPVVILTAANEVDKAARQLEAAGALKKPLDVDQLLDTVARLA